MVIYQPASPHALVPHSLSPGLTCPPTQDANLPACTERGTKESARIQLYCFKAPACPVPRERPAWPCDCSELVVPPKPPELVVGTSGSSLGRGHQSESIRGIKSLISLYWYYCQKSLYSLNSKEHSAKQVRILIPLCPPHKEQVSTSKICAHPVKQNSILKFRF